VPNADSGGMTALYDDAFTRKLSLYRKVLMRKKQELESAIRLLEEYQKLACTWDPNAPRSTQQETPPAYRSGRTPPPVIFGKWKT